MTMVWSPDYAPVDGDFDSVSLLLKGEGTNGSTTILDSSSNNLSVTAFNTAQISTGVNTPFGTGDGVLFFDGNSDYVSTGADLGFAFGTGAFTVETWVNFSALPATNAISGFFNTSAEGFAAALPGDWWLGLQNVSGTTYLQFGKHFTSDNFNAPFSPSLNTWYHVAAARDASENLYLFINGVSQPVTETGTISSFNFNRSGPFFAGVIATPFYLNGYLSNLRITKGVARYTENFDVPTAPFPILSPNGRVTIADDTLDADARQYIINVEEQDGQALEPGVRTAINDFVVGCKSDGIWNAIKASCLLSGARTLEGALVPLKGGAPTNFNFTSSDYDRELGLLGNGSTKYLDSNRNNNTDLQDDRHLSVWVSTAATTSNFGGDIGFYSASNGSSYIGRSGVAAQVGLSSSLTTLGYSSVTGFRGVTRIAGSSYDYRAASSTINIPTNSTAPAVGNINVFRAGVGLYANSRLAFYSIGSNLDLALLDTRISDFITALGAAIP